MMDQGTPRRNSPAVSVIIPYWNNAGTLSECLAALGAQTYLDFEVIIVDNGSTDRGLESLAALPTPISLSVERLQENRGFAVANNIGARLARGEWLALLNADAFPEPGWLAALVDAAGRHPGCSSFASRLVQASDRSRLDGAGDVYHVSGLAWRRAYGAATDQARAEAEVFSPCGAAAFYSREAFLRAGGFDEDFFCYHEDVDLGFRMRLQGGRCIYVPSAVVYHVGSASRGKRSDFVIYHGHRNLVWTFVKDMPTPLFWRYLPAHLFATVVSMTYYSFHGHAGAIWRAKLDAARGLARARRKRLETQRTARVAPEDLTRVMESSWKKPLHSAWRRRE